MTLETQALVFDLDGVLVDSTVVIERLWRRWARRHGFDPEHVLRTAHGRRTVDTIAAVAPALDAEAETRQLVREGVVDTDGLCLYDGAGTLLEQLSAGTWAIATSGTRRTARTRLEFAELPIPDVLITADDVERGKPDPEAYLLAAEQLRVEPARCTVVEDSPAGVEAARRAGMRTVAVTTTHEADQLDGATVVVASIASLRVERAGANLLLHAAP